MIINYLAKGDVHNHLSEFKQEIDSYIISHDIKFAVCVGDYCFFPDENLIKKISPDTIAKYGLERKLEIPDLVNDFKYNIPVCTVPGNHDDQEFLDDRYVNGICKFNDLIFLHGAYYQIWDNVYVFGFGKIFAKNTYTNFTKSEIDKYGFRNQRKKTLNIIKRRNHFTKDEVKRALSVILDFNKKRNWKYDKVIAIFHEAPPLRKKLMINCGSIIIRDLVNLISPDKAYFGHYHESLKFDDNEILLNKFEVKLENLEL